MSNDFLLYSICMLIVLTIMYCYVDVTGILTIQIICLSSKHIVAATYDFQQCGFLTSVDSDEPVQPLVKLRNSK